MIFPTYFIYLTPILRHSTLFIGISHNLKMLKCIHKSLHLERKFVYLFAWLINMCQQLLMILISNSQIFFTSDIYLTDHFSNWLNPSHIYKLFFSISNNQNFNPSVHITQNHLVSAIISCIECRKTCSRSVLFLKNFAIQ